MSGRNAPGPRWLLAVLIAAVLAGGIAQLVAEGIDPVVERTVTEREVLPEDQVEVFGSIDGLVADDAIGDPLPMPIDIDAGAGATIEGALVDGQRVSIVWDGGRPFHLDGTGVIDLGPAHVEVGMGAVFWSLDGLRALGPGEYTVATPVAVGAGGLAEPRESVSFVADEETTITTSGNAIVARPLPAHLEGPGTLTAEGILRITNREGVSTVTRIDFGPGPFEVDIGDDGTFSAVLNGPLTST